MSRIKLGSRVSTEGWCFHSPTVTIHEDRLSWKVFGKKSLDSRVYGTVLGKNGGKWQVMWDIGQWGVTNGMQLSGNEDGSTLSQVLGECL